MDRPIHVRRNALDVFLHALVRLLLTCLTLHFVAADEPEQRQSSEAQPPRRQPLSLGDSLAAFELLPGLQLELVASEPDVIDPVAIRFDHRGRMWVVEMPDYPNGPEDSEEFSGRIKILTDSDDDGHFETMKVFADGLVFPTGIQPFRDGVIATVAGEVLYLADTDGDDVCDHREVWFTGFNTGNEQLRANHPTWTLEQQVHVASGRRGGEVRSEDPRWESKNQPLSLATRDFRFSPFGGEWSSVAGNSQYGFHQDDSGRKYVCSNRNPCILLLAEAAQVQNNPLLPLSRWQVDVMPAAEQSQVFPLVDAWTTSNLHAGQFTAACSVFRYQSDALAGWLADDFFACEPTGSLVQRYRTIGEGVVPKTERGRPQVEFLASRDPWFRPVDLVDGPEGDLYVVDMHRAVIEHPQFMPDELKKRQDLRWGDQAGRIYRIRADEGDRPAGRAFEFDAKPPAEWVETLAHPNRWARTTAARLLREATGQEQDDRAGAGARQQVLHALRNWLAEQSGADMHGVVQALWLLASFEQLDNDHLRQAAQSESPSVRRQAVRLAAERYRNRDRRADSEWLDALIVQLAADDHPTVRYQWLLEFGPIAGEKQLADIDAAVRSGNHDSALDREWICRAASLLADEITLPFLRQQLDRPEPTRDVLEPLLQRLGWETSTAALQVIFDVERSAATQQWAYRQAADGLAARGRSWERLRGDLSEASLRRLDAQIAADRKRAGDVGTPLTERRAALQRLRLDRSDATMKVCRQLLDGEGTELFEEVVQVLRRFELPELGVELAGRLRSLPPRAAAATVRRLVDQPEWTGALLDELEADAIPWSMLDPDSRRRLEQHAEPEIAERFKRLLSDQGSEGREELMARYRKELDGPIDIEAGKQAFIKNCAACHRIDGQGTAVGPDISDLRTQTPEQILTTILDPNAAIDANYYRYSVMTVDGQVYDGLLEESGQESVTLRMQEGERRTISRGQVELLQATGLSMMPEGFEAQLEPDAMRHLIAYLKRWRFPEQQIPFSE